MTVVQLPRFSSRPEYSVGVMTLDDAWLLITQGHLTIEGAKSIFPQKAWDYLPKNQTAKVKNAA